jgi:hypothetical protein
MRLIHLNWNNIKGEGSVTYTKIFNEAHIVVQLDMLQDCIVDLTDKYNSLLSPPNAADDGDFYGLPRDSVSSSKVGGNDLAAGETAP